MTASKQPTGSAAGQDKPGQGYTLRSFPVRNRRAQNAWEPFYDPKETSAFPEQGWSFEHNTGPTKSTFTAEGLKAHLEAGGRNKFEKIRFKKCDFHGVFDVKPREIIFDNCEFEDCDFGLTTWFKGKFSKCKFTRTSFTQSIWSNSEFRDCSWASMGLSGNTTEFSSTIITNPSELVASAHANYEHYSGKNVQRWKVEQWMRLQKTKSEVARVIARMLSSIGDETGYYNSLKTEANASVSARFSRQIFEIITRPWWRKLYAICLIVAIGGEYALLNSAGLINSWGRSVARPTGFGICIMMVFAGVYLVDGTANSLTSAIVKSIEITLLVGYTNFSATSGYSIERILMVLNLLIGLFWYIVFVPTLVNRVSRVR